MWFHLGVQNLIGKKNFNADFCDIYVSDCVSIWHKKLLNDELLSISQRLNPLLEVPALKLRDLVLDSLEDAKAQKEVKFEDDNVTLKIESNILGLKFRFQVPLNRGSNEMFYNEFTVPLLIMLINTQNREKELIKIIEDKDVEIAEYKDEYGFLKSYIGARKPFIRKEFDCQYPYTSINWNYSSFVDGISKLLSSKNIVKDEHEQSVVKEKEDKCFEIKKSDKNQSLFTDKSLNQKIGCKPCVSLDNQILKKRMKITGKSKLKF